jgi:hypothetical protein
MFTIDTKGAARKVTTASELAYALYEVREAAAYRNVREPQLLITMTRACWRDVVSDYEMRHFTDAQQLPERKFAGVPFMFAEDYDQSEPFKIWVLAERRIPERRV